MSLVIVTGDKGFIGSVVREKLEWLGHTVLGIDLQGDTPVDIRNRRELNDAFGSCHREPDAVIHLAALMPPNVSDEEMYETNVIGTANVLSCCKKNYVSRLVFSSSAAVYGDGDTDECTEPLMPISAYGRTKELGELLLSTTDIGSVGVLRFFNVYGHGGHGVVNLLEECVRTGSEFMLRGDGTAVRDFVPVDLIADALVGMLSLAGRHTMNVGLGRGTSVKELLDAALSLREFPVRQVPSLEGEIDQSIAKIGLFRATFPKLYEAYEGVQPIRL